MTLRATNTYIFFKILPYLILFVVVYYYRELFIITLDEPLHNEIPLGEYVSWLILTIYIYKFLCIRMITYTITQDSIIIKRGVFNRTTNYINFYRIKDFRIYRSFFARIIGVMDVTLMSSQRFNKLLTMSGIPNSNLVEILRNQVEEGRRTNRVYEVDHG